MAGPRGEAPTLTELDEAILDGDLRRVQAALQGGVRVDRPVRGKMPLMWAAHAWVHSGRLPGPNAVPTGHLAIIDALLQKKAWPALPDDDRAGFLPWLIHRPGHPVEPDLNIGGPLRLAQLIERLLPHGLDVNGVNAAGETALFAALHAGHGRWAAALIGLGVDPTRTRTDGAYAHEVAASLTSSNWTTLIQVLDAQVRAHEREVELAARPAAPTPAGRSRLRP